SGVRLLAAEPASGSVSQQLLHPAIVRPVAAIEPASRDRVGQAGRASQQPRSEFGEIILEVVLQQVLQQHRGDTSSQVRVLAVARGENDAQDLWGMRRQRLANNDQGLPATGIVWVFNQRTRQQ